MEPLLQWNETRQQYGHVHRLIPHPIEPYHVLVYTQRFYITITNDFTAKLWYRSHTDHQNYCLGFTRLPTNFNFFNLNQTRQHLRTSPPFQNNTSAETWIPL